MNLCDELTIRMLLERHGFHFSKSMGQNFPIGVLTTEFFEFAVE